MTPNHCAPALSRVVWILQFAAEESDFQRRPEHLKRQLVGVSSSFLIAPICSIKKK